MGRIRKGSQYMGSGQESGSATDQVAFVSRRRCDEAGALAPSAGESLPRLLQGRTLLLLLVAAALQAFAWSQLRGYQLADSVEFMDRAYAVARGDSLDSTGAVRGFGFSCFLLPFFALAEWFEVENMRRVVHMVRLLQMAFGLGLVFFCVRIGTRLAGTRVGYVAGYLTAVNPIFLQYSVDPVSGVAAAFFVAWGLDTLIERQGFRKSMLGGMLLGGAFMMAYQTILISSTLVGLLLLRDRRRFARTWCGAAAGLVLMITTQVVLDKLTYGTWGVSVRSYLIENTGGVFFTMVAMAGLQDSEWVRETYDSYLKTVNESAVMQEDGGRGNLQSPFYYLLELPSMLVWPVILVGALGLLRTWLRLNWKSSLLFALFLVNAYAMSMKGSKSFRLWLPLLPMITPLCAWGWGALVRAEEPGPPALWRRLASVVVLLSSLVLGLRALYEINTRRYGAYWDAIDYVSSQAHVDRLEIEARGETFERETVSAAYNWAVFCRSSTDIQVVKFNGHLDQWHALTLEQKAHIVGQMAELDWLVVHGTILRLAPELTTAINDRFEVIASFWDEDTNNTIRDVRVLRNLTNGESPRSLPAGQRARRLFEVVEGMDPTTYREHWQLDRVMPQPALLLGQGAEGREERLLLLGFEIEELPVTNFGWITYHWYTETGFDRDYVLVDRISARRSAWGWQNNHVPGHGTLPTSSWRPGWIVRESYLLVPGTSPFEEDFQPFGGTYRRGDLLPAMLWIHGGSPPPDIGAHMLMPADLRTGKLLDMKAGQPWSGTGLLTPEGYVISRDKLVQVARFLYPVNDRYRWPDDGGPGPDDAVLLANFQRQQLELKQLEAERRAAEEAGGAEDGGAPPDGGEQTDGSGSER